jgi:hypothetical protein
MYGHGLRRIFDKMYGGQTPIMLQGVISLKMTMALTTYPVIIPGLHRVQQTHASRVQDQAADLIPVHDHETWIIRCLPFK